MPLITPLERAGFLAHATLPAFARRVERAQAVIASMFLQCERPYVAFSGGKDSACLLHLVLQIRPTVAARTLTSGETRLLHVDYDQMLLWWREQFPRMDYQEVLADRLFADDWQAADWHTQRKAGKGDIVNLLPQSGDFDGVFIGMRDEESNARRFANKKGLIRRYSVTRGDATAGLWNCCPLAHWTTQDVGAYIFQQGLPLLAEYERAGMDARTTNRLTGDAMRQNGLQALRLRDPAQYNRLLQRFPEVSWWNG